MLKSHRQNLVALAPDPESWILFGLALILGLSFLLIYKNFALVTQGLFILAAGLLVLPFMFPKSTTSAIALALLTLSVPFANYAIFTLGNFGFQVAHLFAIILMFHMAIRFLLGQRLYFTKSAYWLMAQVAVAIISAVALLGRPPEFLSEYSKSISQLVFGASLFLAMLQAKVKTTWLLQLLKAMILLSVGIALFGIYQLPARYFGLPGGVVTLTNPGLSGAVQSTSISNLGRASSIFSEPSFFGHYLVAMLALTITAVLHFPNLFGRPARLWAIIFVQMVALALSLSAGSFYLLTELLVVMLLVEKGLFRKRLVFSLALIILIGVIPLALVQKFSSFHMLESLVARITGMIQYLQGNSSGLITGESLPERIQLNKIGFRIWQSEPLLGIGFGVYPLVSPSFGETTRGGWAANNYILMLAETGIIGFTILLGFFISSLRGLWGVFRRIPRILPDDPVKLQEFNRSMLIARMVFYFVLVEVLYSSISSLYLIPGLWFVFGLGALVTIRAKSSIKESLSTTGSS